MTTGSDFSSYSEVMELLSGKPAREYLPDIISILGNIEGLDEGTLPLLTRLLTTGSENARKEARKAFLGIVHSFQAAYEQAESDHGNMSMEEEDSRWEHFLDGYEHPVIRNNLLGVWNAANVNDESGSGMSAEEVIAGMRSVPFYVEEVDPDVDTLAGSDTYWRGMAAVAISRYSNHALVTMDRMIAGETIPAFISWAGNHDEVTKVIDIARERGTFDRRTLEGILEERHEKTALSSGFL